MIKRVYLDNSVLGGTIDVEFKKPTAKLFDEFLVGYYIPVLSKVTLDELKGAPAEVHEEFDRIRDIVEVLSFTDEAIKLSAEYMKTGRFAKRMLADTLHVAIASVNRIEILVSWNFHDIVNLNRIVIFNSVNIKLGYPLVEIRNPREIIHE